MDENSLVAYFRSVFPASAGVVRRWGGDDGAHLDPSPAEQVAVLDVLVEDVHFTRNFCSYADIGYKAVSVNLSDLAACGARPGYLLLGLSAERSFPEHGMRDFYKGFCQCMKEHGAVFAGGDYTRGEKLVVSVTAVGFLPLGGKFWSRAGAAPGERIYVTGTPGLGLLGLEILQGKRPDYPEALARYRRPVPPCAQAAYLVDRGIPVGACTDISDGLSSELTHLAAESAARFVIDPQALPHPRVADGPLLALHGGDDYELVFTTTADLDPSSFARATGSSLTLIGRVEAGSGVSDLAGKTIGAGGYDHLRED